MAVSKLELLAPPHLGRRQDRTPASRLHSTPLDIDKGPAGAWAGGKAIQDLDPRALDDAFDRLEITYEKSEQLLWCTHGDRERPCYTAPLLSDLLGLFELLREAYSGLDQASFPFRYLVWQSGTPGIWNLGGDLDLFTRLIEAEDVETLRDYAHRCVDTVYQNFAKGDLPYLTLALIQGDALGGGFESALSNDIIIAEEHCQFGLPEVMFNMFPGMGAYSFLSRRLGATEARSMILSGRLYSAGELYDLGLIDMVVPTGTGKEAVRAYFDRNRRRYRALLSMSRVTRRCGGINHAELIDVADIWVENAMGISPTDLRRMRRLVKAQSRRHAEAIRSSTD